MIIMIIIIYIIILVVLTIIQDAEIAWHFYLPGLTSGYMYYGGSQDMPVKQTVACNNAVTYANGSIAKSV